MREIRTAYRSGPSGPAPARIPKDEMRFGGVASRGWTGVPAAVGAGGGQSRPDNLEDTHMESGNDNSTTKIVATLVPSAARLEVLPRHFGRLRSVFEGRVFDWMGWLCPSYSGGYWDFFELSNGGFFMAVQGPPIQLRSENGFEAEMSREAAGMTACLFACSHLSFRYDDETLARHYHWLRDFAAEHAEAPLIWAAID
jgi:Antirestriction protein